MLFAGLADQDRGALEVLSAPCHPQLPRMHTAAVAARRWLHGQISPPRQQLPPHLRSPWLPLLPPAPLLLPGGQDDLGPTPRLNQRQDAHSEVSFFIWPCVQRSLCQSCPCTQCQSILQRHSGHRDSVPGCSKDDNVRSQSQESDG